MLTLMLSRATTTRAVAGLTYQHISSRAGPGRAVPAVLSFSRCIQSTRLTTTPAVMRSVTMGLPACVNNRVCPKMF